MIRIQKAMGGEGHDSNDPQADHGFDMWSDQPPLTHYVTKLPG